MSSFQEAKEGGSGLHDRASHQADFLTGHSSRVGLVGPAEMDDSSHVGSFPRGPGVGTPAHLELYPMSLRMSSGLLPYPQTQELPRTLDLTTSSPAAHQKGLGLDSICCGVMGKGGGRLVLTSLTEDKGLMVHVVPQQTLTALSEAGMHIVLKKRHLALAQGGWGLGRGSYGIRSPCGTRGQSGAGCKAQEAVLGDNSCF